ncbi:MAG: hypothetical protein HYV04_08360, partial [Deltaproteobacteria bacterium]|nr:hypothetical protein [Deltaproteobacteria bacterium]
MKKLLGVIVVGLGLVALAGVATAQWRMGGGAGRFGGMGPGMMGGQGGPQAGGGYGCTGAEATTAAPVTGDKAKELAQQSAAQYLKGFTVERVLPFTSMHRTM